MQLGSYKIKYNDSLGQNKTALDCDHLVLLLLLVLLVAGASGVAADVIHIQRELLVVTGAHRRRRS